MTNRFTTTLRRSIIVLAITTSAPSHTNAALAAANYDKRAAVNDTVLHDPRDYATCTSGGSDSSSVPLTGENPHDVWNLLIAKGLKPFQVAGIMGNMQSESGFDPTLIQGTKTVPAHNSNNPADAGELGYGLVQWSPGSKLIPFLHGKPPSIPSEIDALWEQLTTGSGLDRRAGDTLIGLKNLPESDAALRAASDAFELGYERHQPPPQPLRFKQAKDILGLANLKHWDGTDGGSITPSPVSTTPDTASCPDATQAFTPTTGGCTNPFAAGHFDLHRTDDGVDYGVAGDHSLNSPPIVGGSPQPLLAICDMTIIRSSDAPGWGPGSSFIYAKLTSGPFAGKCWYYAEHLDPNDLPANGKKLKAGEHVATLTPGGWALEVGFAKADHLAATGVGEGGYPSVSGIAAAKFLRSLGAKTRDDPGPGPAVYGGGSCP